MKIYNKEEFNKNKEELLTKIKEGNIFIYPTDTIYGIGCDARNFEAVKRIRELKNRDEKPFSVIAPSKEWIIDNCEEKNLDKLPGPYTLILKLKNKECVASNVSGLDTLGVRIPDHWFKVDIPIVTTSVNKSDKNNMTSLEDLDKDIKVDFIIYEGEKKGKSSKII
tara:strand:- start:354 stop:851 length:498 start_codon:yes stop_codon:yes gene_type:complete